MGYTDESLADAGRAIQQQLWGPQHGGASGGVAGEYYGLVQQYCFGLFWTRENLSVKNRSLVTVSQLAALGRLPELKAHLRGALSVGWTREELIEVLMQTGIYCGVPAGVNALNAAAEVLGEPD